MKSIIQHQFSQVPQISTTRSVFNRSHGHKTTFNEGKLIPIYIDEALPGDTFKLRANLFCRMITPIFPIMDNMYIDTQFWAVPVRLVWDNFTKMMGEQDDPDSSIDFSTPLMESSPITEMSLSDYMGIPIGCAMSAIYLECTSLWHRAYNLIWNQWYRDQNLQDSVVVDKDNGPDAIADYVLLPRGKRHDYFTSCLPNPQKGADAVTLPIGSVAPVIGNGVALGFDDATQVAGLAHQNGTSDLYAYADAYGNAVGTTVSGPTSWPGTKAVGITKIPQYSGLVADLSSATASTINAIREAFQLQKVLERDARAGTRYTEQIKQMFGVTSPDFRLQRPEYLGGSSTRFNVTPVQQTSSTSGSSPLGNLAAFSQVFDNFAGFSKSFTEHTLLLGLMSIRADLTYQQGLNRMFSRRTRYDFYIPPLANLGEQAVLQKEIFADGTPADDNKVFGYQERWAEYRYKPSIITGTFRSNAVLTLDKWHLSEDFNGAPELNAQFIEDNPPITRVVAITSEAHFYLDAFFDLTCARPMPVYSIPGFVDHF